MRSRRALYHQVRQLPGRVDVVEERRLAVLVEVVHDRVVAAEALGETVAAREAELRLQAEDGLRRIERVERRLRRPPFLAEHRENVLIVPLVNRREHGCLRKEENSSRDSHESARRSGVTEKPQGEGVLPQLPSRLEVVSSKKPRKTGVLHGIRRANPLPNARTEHPRPPREARWNRTSLGTPRPGGPAAGGCRVGLLFHRSTWTCSFPPWPSTRDVSTTPPRSVRAETRSEPSSTSSRRPTARESTTSSWRSTGRRCRSSTGAPSPGRARILADGVVAQGVAMDALTCRARSAPRRPTRQGRRIEIRPARELRITYSITSRTPHRAAVDVGGVPPRSPTSSSSPRPGPSVSSPRRLAALQGLAQGADETNCIVVGEDRVENGDLRFADEFVRHKALDLLGDLALVGRPRPRARHRAPRGARPPHGAGRRPAPGALVELQDRSSAATPVAAYRREEAGREPGGNRADR